MTPLRCAVSGTIGIALLLGSAAGATAVARETLEVPSVSASGGTGIQVVQYPKRVRIGSTLGSACNKSVKVKVSKGAAPGGEALDLIFAAYVVGSPLPMDAQRIRNVKPGKTYKLFPYPAPQYGEGYEITLCGTLGSQLLPLGVTGKYVGTLSVDLVRAGEGSNDPVAIRTREIKITWKQPAG